MPSDRPALPTLTPSQRTRVAARAGVDITTVRRYLAGGNVHSTTRDRLERAVAYVQKRQGEHEHA